MRQKGVLWQRRWLLGLLPLLLLMPHALGLVQYQLITRLDQQIYDTLLLRASRAAPALDTRIVIVDIDEASLQKYGRWPWARDVLARLSEELLRRQQVAVLGFDVLFAEPERPTWSKSSLSGDKEITPAGRGGDTQLADALTGAPVALGYYVFTGAQPAAYIGKLPRALQLQRGAAAPEVLPAVPAMKGFTGGLPLLVDAAPNGGFLNADSDSDGVLRRIPLLVRDGQEAGPSYYPSLSLAMYLAALQVAQVRLVSESAALHGTPLLQGIELQQGAHKVLLPTAVDGSFLVPFHADSGRRNARYRYVSAGDVLSGALPKDALRGKLVLVGTSVPGLRDVRATPVSTTYPGVEVHASALSAMLDGQFLQVPDYARAYVVLGMVLSVGVLLLVLSRASPLGAMFWSLGVAGLQVTANWLWFEQAGLVLPLAAGLMAILLTYVLHVMQGYFIEQRTKRQLVELFGHYVPEALVARMARAPQTYSMEARSSELTVMFCDLQQFTSLSETMEPVKVQSLLNNVFNRMARVIAAGNGTIDKYIGDCVMVFWGAPLKDTEHAWHGVHTALGIHAMLRAYNEERARQGRPALDVTIGINTGVMSVGDMGSDLRRSYTVIGDAVNVAARLEPLAKVYGVPLVAGERTRALVPQCHWQWLDRVRVAGRARALDIYAPYSTAGTLDAAQQRELDDWNACCAAYRERDWNRCECLLQELRRLAPSSQLYALYADRVQAFRDHPPSQDWDGVTQQEWKRPGA